MKKRAKIITTIASLCLAVALMAFGVYAATSVSFNVASKVSFTVRDVFVDIAGKIELQDNVGGTFKTGYANESYTTTAEDGWAQVGVQVNSADNGTGAYWDSTGNFSAGDTWASEAAAATYAATSYTGTLGENATPREALDDAAWYAGTAKLDSTVNAVRYTIEIENKSSTNKVFVSANKVATDFAGANAAETMTYALDVTTGTSGAGGTMADQSGAKFVPGGSGAAGAYVEVPANATLTLVYTYTFSNFTSAITATAFLDDITFTIVDENAGSAPAASNVAGYVAS